MRVQVRVMVFLWCSRQVAPGESCYIYWQNPVELHIESGKRDRSA
jgi:hypothetical protein